MGIGNVKPLNSIKSLFLGILCALISSFSFTTGMLTIRFPAYQRILYIISGIQFWFFLFAEIAFLIISKKKMRNRNPEKIEAAKRIIRNIIIAFAVSLAVFAVTLIATRKSATAIGMIVFSVTVFLLHMIVISNTKAFINMVEIERK